MKYSAKTVNLIISDDSHKNFMCVTSWQPISLSLWVGNFLACFKERIGAHVYYVSSTFPLEIQNGTKRNIHFKRHSTALFLFSFFSLSYFDGVNKIMFPLLFDHIVMKLNRINHPLTHVLFPSEIIINAQLETTFIEIWSVDKSHIKSSSNKLAIDYYFYDYFYFDITHHLVFDKTMK